jgi:hypothetical protein
MSKKYDLGGPDRHVIEKCDFHSIEGMQGTWCSTMHQLALMAYYCGTEVAENQDIGLDEKQQKHSYVGVMSFSAFISCHHKQGECVSMHCLSLYHIGVGTEDPVTGYSHAFNIIAQPDSSFYWLATILHQPLLTSKLDGKSQCIWKAICSPLIDRSN